METRPPFRMTPWVLRLLIANAVVYLLTITVFTGRWFFDLFAFSPAGALERPWSFLSYMFLHGGFMHLAFNMLMLFFFGSAVEERMGAVGFIRYYVICGLGGAVLSFAIALFTPVAPFVGASAAVLGVALAFAMFWPDAEIYVFPLPVPIKARTLVIFLAAMDLILGALGAADRIAHFAHLGGFAFGFLYLKGGALLRNETAPSVTPRHSKTKVLVHPTAMKDSAETKPPPAERRDRELHEEINRVLDKISATGMDSLTEEERQLLDKVSRELRRH